MVSVGGPFREEKEKGRTTKTPSVPFVSPFRAGLFVGRIELLVVVEQEADQLRVAVRPLKFAGPVERPDGIHLRGGELEIENIQILLHAVDVRGFRDGDDAALDEVPQGHLRNRSAMAFGDGLERRIFEQVGIGLGYRCPRHDFPNPTVG